MTWILRENAERGLKRVLALVALAAPLPACAATIPQAEIDRCNLGVADGNDRFTMRQGPACRRVAERLTGRRDLDSAVGYARRACQLQDPRGCEEYLEIVREEPRVARSELQAARAAGERACAGLVVAADGVDVRPRICARTAQLFMEVQPTSRDDASRLYARACMLGSTEGCQQATALGAEIDALVPRTSPAPPAATVAPPPPSPVCHSMRSCVQLNVTQHNNTEIVGTLTSRCDRSALCSFCPSRGTDVDRAACHRTTLEPNESKTGREAGLWYDGYSAIAYDCTDASDDKACLP